MIDTVHSGNRHDPEHERWGAVRRFAEYLERHAGQKFAFAVGVSGVVAALWSFVKPLI